MKSAPPIDPTLFQEFLNRIGDSIGEQWVYHSESEVGLYRDAYSPKWGEAGELLPSAAVAPATTEEVQTIVRLANEYRVPLFPISTGKNLGYGGSAPAHTGSVIVDLKRMNRILEVDDQRHFAIVEPGVSYYDLYHHIQTHQLRVWIDCPEPGWGSVVGNALDRGIGWTWGEFRDHFRSHCGLEAVLPNGDIIRTGMGALPGADTWGQYAHGFGPSVDGLFAQGNFGIVTKMGFWLMPEPECYQTCHISASRRQDLLPLVDVLNDLEHSQIIGLPLYDSPLTYNTDPALLSLIDVDGLADDSQVDRYASENSLPVWEVTLPFYGPEETVAANISYAERRLRQRIPNLSFKKQQRYRFPMSTEDKKKVPFRVAIGAPNLDAFAHGARSKFNPHPFDGHLLFAPVIPKTGEAALKAARVLSNIYRNAQMPGYNHLFAAPQAWLYRSFVMIVGFPISRSDQALNERSRNAYRQALEACAEHGWGEYRASPMFSDAVAAVYGYNNHSLQKFVERLKDAADPNGIVAPGRGGIWPDHLRDKKGQSL